MGRLFGTDGARGVAITELTCEIAMNIGRAAAIVLTKHNKSGKNARLIIGKDTRISSDVLEAALSAGVASVGADVELIGVVPTPAVAYLVKKYNADAGVMISASHNSVEYNGIKLFSNEGFKLPDCVENEIEELILDKPDEIQLVCGKKVGRISCVYGAAEDYIDHVARTCDIDLSGLTVAVDCANGSSAKTAAKLFAKLNVKCVFTADSPDGLNINDGCGSTHIERLEALVKESKADFGVAFDGDADRCLAVDENGKLVDGDKLIAIISNGMKKQGTLKNNTSVVTVMSNLGFHEYMKNNGISTVCTKVGDRYVLEEMLKNGYNIGGEQSGHIILLDHSTTGDGQMTAVQLMCTVKREKMKLSELANDIMDYPQVLLNVTITEDKRGLWDKTESIVKVIDTAEKALGNDGRILVRESGTEPLLRVMIEGKDKEAVNMWAEKIVTQVKAELC